MARSHLVIDIETVLDPELPIAESAEVERLPSPPHHRVVVIGALHFGRDYECRKLGIVGRTSEDEAEILTEFAKILDEHQPCLVTYNGRGFDLPVIAMRCLRHGIPFRHYYQNRDVRYRFSAEGHLDLMDFVADYGASKPSRLDIVAKLCGMPGKVGVDGKDVGPLVHAGRIEEVRDYCLCDVVQTAAVFLRVQLLRGELDREAYLVAMENLLAVAREDGRVAPVLAGVNEERLLLRSSGPRPNT